MNHPLLFHIPNNHNVQYNGSNTYAYCDPVQNNLHIKKNAYNSYTRYMNNNPNIQLNKDTNKLPLSVQLNYSDGMFMHHGL